MTPNNPKLNKLLEDHKHCNLLSELSEPTSFKSINPTCTDNFLTDTKIRFTQNFDSWNWCIINSLARILRSAFIKGKPNKIFYRFYKNFNNAKSEEELKE